MACLVEYTDEFGAWWLTLTEKNHEDISAVVQLLEERGTKLGFPFSSSIIGSQHAHLRELRIQSSGQPIRILYAFDPRRVAILLIGGNKKGNDRWYKITIAQADQLYTQHLTELEQEKHT